jgi:protein HOOK3
LKDPVDFNAIAEHEDAEQTIKVATYDSKVEFGITDICVQLLTILLLAAVHGTNKEKYVQAITRLDLESQTEIASIIQKVSIRNFGLEKWLIFQSDFIRSRCSRFETR